ncbi:MarR family winged helix-turn-helix transcriptional regulator [Marinitoga lauensis]|uniref:MarR family winged helix-turn-helix transcriptional regulator n=1 Tax=Marinitoga lauensis TaxID=2201189 RepID=UPI00101188E2|nr:MarR family transcriptional regulator [Marinitoga lauensis]
MPINPEQTFELLFDFISNFTRIVSDFSEAEKLKTLEFYVVLYIGLKGPQKMTNLAKKFSTTKSNITNIVDSLEKKGYVERIRSNKDRRVILISLISKGEKVFEETLKNFKIMFNDFMSKVSKKTLKLFQRVL